MSRTKHAQTRVIVSGCCGRMGQRVIAVARETTGVQLVGAVERLGHNCVGQDVGLCTGGGQPAGIRVETTLQAVARRGDVVIDFSTPTATMGRVRDAATRRCPMVIGTTGLSMIQQAAIRRAARRIPILLAPNMSVGINVLCQLVTQAAQALGLEYEVEIIEAHHSGKQDAPSGTALRLADVVASARRHALGRVAVYGRRGRQPRGSAREIGIHAIRAGDIVGDHQVVFAATGERIELAHRATSRDTFVHGALRAAQYVFRRKAGLYDMYDVLQRRANA